MPQMMLAKRKFSSSYIGFGVLIFIFIFSFFFTVSLHYLSTTERRTRILEERASESGEKPKAVIYILTQKRRLTKLLRLLQELELNFNSKFGYPILLFVEKV